MSKDTLKHHYHPDDERLIGTPQLLRYWPYLLRYPLSGVAGGVVVFFSFLMFMGFAASLLGLMLLVMIIPIFIKYSSRVLQHTALGHAHPPPLTLTEILDGNAAAWKLLIIVAAFVTVAYHLWQLHDITGFIAIIVLCFLLPASTAILALEGSLFEALDPIRLVKIAAQLGVHYWVSVVFYTIACVSFVFALAQFPDFLSMFFGLMLTLYLVLLTSHLLGFSIYHQHNEVGIVPFNSEEQRAEKELRATEAVLDTVLSEVYRLVMVDKTKAAMTCFRQHLAKLGNDLALHERLFERLKIWDKKELFFLEASIFLRNLIQADKLAKALLIYRETYQVNPEFQLDRLDHTVILAERAYNAQEFELANQLVNNYLAVADAQHAAQFQMLFLQAKLANEYHQIPEQAKNLLKPLLSNNEHPQFSAVQHYAKCLLTATK